MDPTTLFEDGIRQIDFVVVLETARIKLSPDDVTEATRLFDDHGEQLELWRKNFMQGIISQGLEIEEEICNQEKTSLHFIKIHGPWELLSGYAQDLNIEVPLKEMPKEEMLAENVFDKFFLKNLKVPYTRKQYHTAPFRLDRLKHFIGANDRSSIFLPPNALKWYIRFLLQRVLEKKVEEKLGLAV